ncbi:MAG: DNA polymerase IV [Puniceicoccales bacterium]|nr:DNA polymerase IV [Puniceicoccales bacterium]
MGHRDAFSIRDDNRKIIHVDMDAFFAAIEQRDHPELQGKPVIVGGDPWDRGVISTCSYEARTFGIRAGMATHRALQLCPQATLLPVRMVRYRAISDEIFDIFRQVTPLVEGMSIDEAYLDVTANVKDTPSATDLARCIREKIFSQTGLAASAGVSFNMFLSKIASELSKPNGLVVITPDCAANFLETLPVHRFHGIGRVTATRLHSMNVRIGRDLKNLPMETLLELFGKVGSYYYEVVRGIDRRRVTPVRVPKSFGREKTFSADTADFDFLREQIWHLGLEVGDALRRLCQRAWAITLKIKYADFHQITRCRQLPLATTDAPTIANRAILLFNEYAEMCHKKIRLVGVSATLKGRERQPSDQKEFKFVEAMGLQ